MEQGHGFWQCVQCTQPVIGRKLADIGITQRADTAITIQNIGQVNVQELLYSARYGFETRPGRIIFLPRFSWFPQSLQVNIAALAHSRLRPPFSHFTQINFHHSKREVWRNFFCRASTRLRVTVPPPREFAITLNGHTTIGRTPLDEWSARSESPTHSIRKNVSQDSASGLGSRLDYQKFVDRKGQEVDLLSKMSAPAPTQCVSEVLSAQ